MISSNERSLAASVVSVSNDDFEETDVLNDGLTWAFAPPASGGQAYAITINLGGFDNTDINDWYYVWQGAAADQNDTLANSLTGAFQMGPGDDKVVNQIGGDVNASYAVPYYLLGEGNDNFSTTGAPSTVYGGAGDDEIIGGDRDDQLWGDTADTFVFNVKANPPAPSPGQFQLDPYDPATDGDDLIEGNAGNDTINGGNGNNILYGGPGADTVIGGTGADYLYGGPRGEGFLDILTGGGGSDAFLLSYSTEDVNDGSGFWADYFGEQTADLTGRVVEEVVADALEESIKVAGSVLIGAIGGDLVTDFIEFLVGLDDTPKPVTTQDVMMVTDFDPSMDVLILPLITSDTEGNSLISDVTFFDEFADGSKDAWGIQFLQNSTLFAEVRLSDAYITALGYAPTDRDAPIDDILTTLTTNPALLTSDGSFSNLANPEVLKSLPSGGFTPAKPGGDAIPSGATVNVFGAIGGLMVANNAASSVTTLAGSQYSDALTINEAFVDPATVRVSDLQQISSTLFGFGGGDVLYGGQLADTLHGGDGDDALYSFADITTSSTPPNESLSGGAGDDILYGGVSGGTFDGGAGTDTFGVVYGNLLKNALDQGPDGMQLVVDLTQGYAAERPASEDPNPGTAPAGAAPPFGTDVPNVYNLVDIENAIGGPLNDWIRGASGSVIEGGPGADAIDGVGASLASYASSAEGVTANLYTNTFSGGDAEGDIVTAVEGLVGSEHDDVLTDYGVATLTGLGGADTFAYYFAPTSLFIAEITDFSAADGDRVDLRPQGVTAAEFDNGINLSVERSLIFVEGPNSPDILQINMNTNGVTADSFIFATAASGLVRGTTADDAFVGGSGRDQLLGAAGNDNLFGGEGADLLKGGAGMDQLRGGAGRDVLLGGRDADILDGGAGADTIDGGAGDDILVGGFGDDVLLGDLGLDTAIFAGAFADHRITGTDTTTSIVEDLFGGGGRDTLDSVELLQFDDGIFDLRTGTFDDGDADAPNDQLDHATIATAEAEPLITAPAAADVEPLLTPVVA